jgi:hypothetical protein
MEDSESHIDDKMAVLGMVVPIVLTVQNKAILATKILF